MPMWCLSCSQACRTFLTCLGSVFFCWIFVVVVFFFFFLFVCLFVFLFSCSLLAFAFAKLFLSQSQSQSQSQSNVNSQDGVYDAIRATSDATVVSLVSSSMGDAKRQREVISKALVNLNLNICLFIHIFEIPNNNNNK